jgi:hypothetical protein
MYIHINMYKCKHIDVKICIYIYICIYHQDEEEGVKEETVKVKTQKNVGGPYVFLYTYTHI